MISKVYAQALETGKEQVSSDIGVAKGGVTELLTDIVTNIPLWIAAFVVLVITIIVANLLKSAATRALIKARGEEAHEGSIILIGRVTYLGVISIGVVIALNIIGADLGWFLGSLGIGVGFALKDLINNFVSGVIILMQGDINIGDFIGIGELKGTIINIQPRATILQALDGTEVTVPNGDILSKEVTCFTSNPFRRIEIQVGISFDTDLELAKSIALEVVKKHEKIEPKPEPAVIFSEFSDSSIVIKIRFWVKSRGGWLETKSELIRNIKKAFDVNNINIPFPIYTLQGDPNHPLAFSKGETHTENQTQQSLKKF